jgi:hypothetical protein
MQRITKVAASSAAALAIVVAGGLAIALPAQASTIHKSTSVVENTSATDTDTVENQSGDQNGVDDATETETAGTETAGESATETGTESGTENTSDDINGVAVEDGHQD